jgi:murein DD-endopeptidase MepM/ murein hydrolase activator NlpD
MRKIDAYVLLGLKGKRKSLNDQIKNDLDSKRRADRLNTIKQEKANPINFIKDKLPRTGLLDFIRNFILYTFLGAATPLFLKSLPAVLNVVKFLVPFGKGIGEFASNVLGGVVNAIDFGYIVHDKMRGIIKTVTGSKYEKDLDSLEKNLNLFLNGAIVLGLAVASSNIGMGGTKSPANARKNVYNKNQSSTNLKKSVKPVRAPGKILKPVGKFGRIFGRIPVIGTLIDFALSMMMGEPIGRAAAKAIGSGIGLGIGALIPVIGQIGVGPIIGSIIGDIIGGALYDTLSAFGRPKKHASGGKVGSKSPSRTPRTIKSIKTKRPSKQPRQRTNPGKNVGGEEAIRKIFPSTKDTKTANSFNLLTKNSAIMKKAGVFGNLMGAGLDMMALGQKIEKTTLSGLENYLGYAIQSAIDDQTVANAKVIGNSMFAMANGGIVPASRTISQNNISPGATVAKEIVNSFSAMLDSKSSEIFQNIRREMMLKFPGGDKETAPVEPDNQDFEHMSGYGTNEQKALLKAISFSEGTTRGYGIIYGGANVPELESGQLTISEVLEMQKTGMVRGRSAGYKRDKYDSDATGKYQFMSYTLREEVAKQGFSLGEKFTPELQDKLILGRITRLRGVTPELLKREGLSAKVSNMLAPEFASFPTLSGGSYYGQPVKGLKSIQNYYTSSLRQESDSNVQQINQVVTSGFGWRWGREHRGIDIASEDGNSTHLPVIVKVGGRVDYAGIANDGNGIVIITHPNGDVTRYIHLNNFRVREGQNIGAGTIIGRLAGMGERGIGRSTGPHLHFEYKPKGGAAIDPKSVWRKYVTLGRSTASAPTKSPTRSFPTAARPTGRKPARIKLKTPSEQSSIPKPLKIASSPQLSNLQRITNMATGVYSDIEKQTQILIQPIIV